MHTCLPLCSRSSVVNQVFVLVIYYFVVSLVEVGGPVKLHQSRSLWALLFAQCLNA